MEKMSEERQWVSSNKTMRLSKPRQLEELSANANHLEMQIYASLINVSKVESKEGKSGEKSELEEEVFLNDFSMEGMEEEREDERDQNFGGIEIGVLKG